MVAQPAETREAFRALRDFAFGGACGDGVRFPWAIGYSPSKKSVERMKQKVGELLDRRNVAPWEEVCRKLNRKLSGWRQYFSIGTTRRAYQPVDEHVYDRVRNFLRRRHKVSSQGTRQFTMKRIYGELGVFRLRGPLREARS